MSFLKDSKSKYSNRIKPVGDGWQQIARSRIALQNTGFQNISVANQSILGDFGQYKGTVRRAASEKVAFFVVAGFNTDTAFRRVSEIHDNF